MVPWLYSEVNKMCNVPVNLNLQRYLSFFDNLSQTKLCHEVRDTHHYCTVLCPKKCGANKFSNLFHSMFSSSADRWLSTAHVALSLVFRIRIRIPPIELRPSPIISCSPVRGKTDDPLATASDGAQTPTYYITSFY
jgi:hypothetical protein